jgi:hypothetical protein
MIINYILELFDIDFFNLLKLFVIWRGNIFAR